MDNFKKYFLRDKKIYLENISYETVENGTPKLPVRRLGCKDTVIAQLFLPTGVKIIFNRRLSFEPEALFTLSVSFGAFFRFNPEYYEEVDWQQVNIVQEFTKNYPDLLSELTSRTTLLVAQITSASGGTPLITAVPNIPKAKNESEI